LIQNRKSRYKGG